MLRSCPRRRSSSCVDSDERRLEPRPRVPKPSLSLRPPSRPPPTASAGPYAVACSLMSLAIDFAAMHRHIRFCRERETLHKSPFAAMRWRRLPRHTDLRSIAADPPFHPHHLLSPLLSLPQASVSPRNRSRRSARPSICSTRTARRAGGRGGEGRPPARPRPRSPRSRRPRRPRRAAFPRREPRPRTRPPSHRPPCPLPPLLT